MPDFINKTVLFERINNAARDLALARISQIKEKESDFIKHTKDAGEAISQALELGMKHHLNKNLSSIERQFFFLKRANLWELCEKYINLDGSPGDYYYNHLDNSVDPDVDFVFLRENKNKLTNEAKHLGRSPDYELQLKYFEEVSKYYKQYIDAKLPIKSISDFEKVDFSNWDLVYNSCDRFDSEERNFVLIIGKCPNVADEYLKSLALCNWDLIIDLDPNSRDNGFYNAAYKTKIPSPVVIKPNDNISNNTFSPYNQSHYHYFIDSYNGSGLLPAIDYNLWNQKYSRANAQLIRSFSSVFANQKTIVLILNSDYRFVNIICEEFSRNLGDSVSFVIANDLQGKLQQIVDFFKAAIVNITIPELSNGFRNYSSNFENESNNAITYELPFLSTTETKNVTGILTPDEFAQLEEDFEVFHLGLPGKDITEERSDFLSGANKITPYGLKYRFDVERQNFQKKYIKPIEELIANGKGKVTLQHEAGFGGSTIARRIAWTIHTEHPTLILRKFRENKIREKLLWLHQKTRKTTFVIVEVPQTVTLDEFEALYRTIPVTRPVTFLIVKRGKPGSNDLSVPDWGNDTLDLTHAYKPYIDSIKDSTIRFKKDKELERIPTSTESYKKTPFYIGLLTFDERFFAIKSYIANFISEIENNTIQRKALSYLTIAFDYLGLGLPASFLKIVFGYSASVDTIFRLENCFSNNSTICSSLLYSKTEGKLKYWQLRHAFLARELKIQLLGGNTNNPEYWKHSLSSVCISFIEDSVADGFGSDYMETLLQKLFIGNQKDRAGDDFTPLINDIPTLEEKESVYIALTQFYPENPHYCSHLARFYAYSNKNPQKAIEYADKAINLSRQNGEDDPLLHHIKGMCLRVISYDAIDYLIQRKQLGRTVDSELYDKIIFEYIPQAEAEFVESRKITNKQNKADAHGYVAHIQLLTRALDFGIIVSGETKSNFISKIKDPFAAWLDLAEGLLEDVKTMIRDGGDNEKIDNCENELGLLYENYGEILQNLQNRLNNSSDPSRTRRQIARVYMRRKVDYYKDDRVLDNILDLLETNISQEPENPKNFFLWFQAARYSKRPIDQTIAKLTQWKAQSSSIEPIFYLYILKVIKALDGYTDAAIEASKLIKECEEKGRNRITVYEWYGIEPGLKRIVNRTEITNENKHEKLAFVEGYFTEFEHIGDGTITIVDQLKVFFSPALARVTSSNINSRVKFYLGFSYDGLRADSISVKIVE